MVLIGQGFTIASRHDDLSVFGLIFFLFPLSYQVLYLLGAMALSMALQLDRHGLWNLLGPSLFALGIMAIAWVSSTVYCAHA